MFTTVQTWFQRAARPFSAERYDAVAHERLRLYTLVTIALLKLFNLFGGNWDIQWHVAVGRDSLWIPPHMLVVVAFITGSAVVLAAMAYETFLAQSGIKLDRVARVGAIRAPIAYFGIYFGYTAALLSGVFDELWHRAFGIDATLWSLPHLGIMASTMLVDVSLLVGITAAGRALKWPFHWRSPVFWGLMLAGAYTFEAVNFQMSEAFVEGYRAQGAGLMGILFPVLAGIMFPFPLLLSIKLSRRFWIAGLICAAAIALQYVGTGVAAAGFAWLKPESAIEQFVRNNPESTIAKAREFARLMGFTSLIGFQQAWIMWLSAVPLALVSLLEWWPWARKHVWVAAPIYSASLVVVSYVWFQQFAVLAAYHTPWTVVALGALVAAAGGLVFAQVGQWVATLAEA